LGFSSSLLGFHCGCGCACGLSFVSPLLGFHCHSYGCDCDCDYDSLIFRRPSLSVIVIVIATSIVTLKVIYFHLD
jgi:hypothetical protein